MFTIQIAGSKCNFKNDLLFTPGLFDSEVPFWYKTITYWGVNPLVTESP